ncbi:MAG: tRNA (adenosine(37)-N6)-threonylcarbamoyltransferase complex ATPase subunit type 1 TsaE [Candidatus Nomurabacteria bacterium]|nr:MAG: tRNA (adenosine(37)-N6)-threonylcarbamoyltransferase complex ATPase subunit type 1 TsaE [Candidatus Nomurabacteria bacterium]
MPTSRHLATPETYYSSSPADTRRFAQKFSRQNLGGTLVLLYGPVGAGKTTFTQALAKSLGVKEPVRSPTFVLVKMYSTLGKKIQRLMHIDAYRLGSFAEVEDLGMSEYLGQKNTVTVVEWPKGKRLEWPQVPTYRITITPKGKMGREISVTKPSGARS